jgi:hypothetical protein
MSLFDWFKTKNIIQEESKKSTYKFTSEQHTKMVEKYEYEIKANSEKEAFKILIEYFYGKNNFITRDKVKSRNCTSYFINACYTIGTDCMPSWFARILGGRGAYALWNSEVVNKMILKDEETLKKYAQKHNIILKEE